MTKLKQVEQVRGSKEAKEGMGDTFQWSLGEEVRPDQLQNNKGKVLVETPRYFIRILKNSLQK